MLIDEIINLGKKNGHKTCIIDNNNHHYSWSEYIMKAIEIASSLYQLGIRSEQKILIICQNKLNFFFIAMACLYINITFIPFHLEDINVDLNYIHKIIIDNNCAVIFSDNVELLQKIDFNNSLFYKKKTKKEVETKILYFKKVCTKNDYTITTSQESSILSWDIFIQLSQENYIPPSDIKLNEVIFILCCKKEFNKGNKSYFVFTEEQIDHQIELLLSNYGFSNESFISLFPLNNIVTILLDFFLHFKSNNLIHFIKLPNTIFDGKMLIDIFKNIKPTIVYLTPYLWCSLKQQLDNDLKLWSSYTLVSLFILGIKYLNLRYYQIDLVHPIFKNFINLFHYVIFLISKFYLRFYGLDKCRLFFNILDYLNKEFLEYFAEINIPIFQIVGKTSCYGIFSLSNRVEFDNMGFPVKQITISDSNKISINLENNPNKLYITNQFGRILSNQKLVLYSNCQNILDLDFFLYFENRISNLEKMIIGLKENKIKIIFIVFESNKLLINDLVEKYNNQVLKIDKKITSYEILLSQQVNQYRDGFFRIKVRDILPYYFTDK